MEIDDVVRDFIQNWRPTVREERSRFEKLPNLKQAIREAALCERPDGKREHHQRRLPRRVLEEAECRLQDAGVRLKSSSSYSILHAEVATLIGDISGIGDLAIYDIAVRIGAFLKLRPAAVYLHSGTADGAKRLGLRGRVIQREALPEQFKPLDSHEIESCLCIYKDCLPGGPHAKHSANSCFSSIRPACGGGRRIC